MIKFISTTDKDDLRYDAVTSIEMTVTSHTTLPDLCSAFGRFLKAAGYVFNGEVEIVDADDLQEPSHV